MTYFKGFKTKEEAKQYKKEVGKGEIYTRTKDKYSPYEECVHLGGLNPEKYPFVVIIRGV